MTLIISYENCPSVDADESNNNITKFETIVENEKKLLFNFILQ